jgi:lactate racemase
MQRSDQSVVGEVFMGRCFVRYGKERLSFTPPGAWNILTFAAFSDQRVEKDPAQLTRSALASPIRSSALKSRLSPSDTVSIIIEDHTRYLPKKIILRSLLEELESAGVSRRNITVVLALGTHKGPSPEEMSAGYGKDVVKEYAIVPHDCHASDLVEVAKLRSGTPVRINRRVYESSFRIGIGSIVPHAMNGFGGGGKILFPGVADFGSILDHHLKYSFREGAELGALPRPEVNIVPSGGVILPVLAEGESFGGLLRT